MRAALWLLLMGSTGAALAVGWLQDDVTTSTVQPTDRAARVARPADAAAFSVAAPTAAPPTRTASATAEFATAESARSKSARSESARTESARAVWPAISPSARQAWSPPPAPPPPPSPPPPPVVVPAPAPPPAFPYQWLGEVEQEGRLLIFLAGPQRTLAVAAGDVLDQRWRVDGADAGRLLLTWLPTHTAVTVAAR